MPLPIDGETTFQKCCSCHISKPLVEFHQDHSRRLGRYPECKDCHNRRGREAAAKQRAIREAQQPKLPDRHQKCPKCQRILPYEAFYTSSYSPSGRNCHCKECIGQTSKERYKRDATYREKLRAKRRAAYQKELSEGRNTRKEWAARNPERQRAMDARSRAKKRERARSNPTIAIELRVHGILRRSLAAQSSIHGRSLDWGSVLGYTSEQLRTHVEERFQPGMTWEAFTAGQIELDHVIPRCSFYYETEDDEDFKRCWSLDNLTPLWKSDNRAKGRRMPDGSDGKLIGERKMRLIAEEASVAGYEHRTSDDAFP
jgi:hypothetical protein